MAKSGMNKENTKVRRSLNRHWRRFCKQKTSALVISDSKDSLSIYDLALKKTSGWLTW